MQQLTGFRCGANAPAMKLPTEWKTALEGYVLNAIYDGSSSASVYRLTSANQPPLFLKTEPDGPFAELPGETDRLRWMAQAGIPAPRVKGEFRDGERNWLLMSAVPGNNLALSSALSAEQVIGIIADALVRLHSLDVRTCPFDSRLKGRLGAARQRVECGLVDECDFDVEQLGRGAEDLLDELLSSTPKSEDLVVVHGDFCSDNLMATDERFSGFVDCGRFGVADRHQDLAIAARSVDRAFGKEWIEPLFRLYGQSADERRLDYYRLLDELF